jgi:hypothetical protein
MTSALPKQRTTSPQAKTESTEVTRTARRMEE